jgi:hypothetical protein
VKKTPLSHYTDEELLREVGRRNRAKQTHLPNPPKLSECPKCHKMLNARQRRMACPEHKPKEECQP